MGGNPVGLVKHLDRAWQRPAPGPVIETHHVAGRNQRLDTFHDPVMISSIHAVKENFAAMVVWSICIFVLVALGFAAGAAGFIIIMPLLSYASWHGYIAVIKTKTPRGYE